MKQDPKDQKKKDATKPAVGKEKPDFVEKPVKNPPKTGVGQTKKPESAKHKVDFEPEMKLTNEELEFIFEGDLSDQEQYKDIVESFIQEVSELDEDLSQSARLKRAMTFRRARVKIKRARQLAMRRRATSATIGKRSRRSAVDMLKTRFAGGRNTRDLSVSEKNRVERMVKARRGSISRLARKLVASKRRTETDRLSHKRDD